MDASHNALFNCRPCHAFSNSSPWPFERIASSKQHLLSLKHRPTWDNTRLVTKGFIFVDNTIMDFSYKSISNIPSVVWYHLKEGNVNWTMTIWSILMHSLTLKGLTVIPQCKPETLLFAFLLWPITYVCLKLS